MVEAAPLYSVIVPTCNRTGELRRCLAQLSAQTAGTDFFEVIVSDDGDSAANLVASEFPAVRCVRGPRRGPAANRNCGAAAARGTWLVFIDDDCLPEPGLLQAYKIAAEAHPATQVFEGRTYADRAKRSACEVAPLNEDGGRLWSCNFAIKRELFSRLGGFDERFPYAAMEDMDLHCRLTAAGEKPYFVAQAAVCHPWRQITDWSWFRRHLESTLLYLQLHPEERRYLNSAHYAKVLLRRFFETSIPALFTGDLSGLRYQFYDHLYSLCMILRLLGTTYDRSHHSGTSSGN